MSVCTHYNVCDRSTEINNKDHRCTITPAHCCWLHHLSCNWSPHVTFCLTTSSHNFKTTEPYNKDHLIKMQHHPGKPSFMSLTWTRCSCSWPPPSQNQSCNRSCHQEMSWDSWSNMTLKAVCSLTWMPRKMQRYQGGTSITPYTSLLPPSTDVSLSSCFVSGRSQQCPWSCSWRSSG